MMPTPSSRVATATQNNTNLHLDEIETINDAASVPVLSTNSNVTNRTIPKAKKTKASRVASLPTQRAELNNPAYIAELLDTEYHGISLYSMAMVVLVSGILWTGIRVVEQIQTYHQQYGTLLQLKREFRQLQIEHQRMLIEQQTFSSTPQVLNRATTELNMFYPNLSDRMILHANQAAQTVLPYPNDPNSLAMRATAAPASAVQP